MAGPEFNDVELPFIRQLQAQGWEYLQGSLDDPAATGRGDFAQVIQEDVLREQLYRLNRRDGQPWLDEERLSQAAAALTRIPAAKLMEANQAATELLLNGTAVDGLPDWDGGRGQTVRYIDWDEPENNRYTVINQYKVKCPPGHDGAAAHIIPDLVLLVNGIPLVVVECKGRGVPEGLPSAVDQLRRYTNQRKAAFEVEDNEGAPALFHSNQLLIASNFDDARVGTIGAGFDHYLNWKTVAPRTEGEAAAALAVTQLSSQQRLIAGMLTKTNLLDIVRHYTLFMNPAGQTIKAVCRYQQFRAVTKAIERLKTGETRLEDGEHDRRGGIIWHTQGSGKSLSMVFLVRKLRTDPDLRRFKVVVITDRKDLQTQLAATASLTGENVEVAKKTGKLKSLVKRPGPGLVFATIQKYREPEEAAPYRLRDERVEWDRRDAAEQGGPRPDQPFELLNDSADILVMIDEAHRTQAGDLHANLLRALPNCARIGFTGTPIIMGEKKRTHEIFGEFIDRYTIKESERDGATVPVLYEGRTASGAVKEGGSLDELFEDLFRERSPEELEAIKKKYATKGQILEAPKLIEEKAADMLRHYVIHMLPNGYKAQVAAYSRRAAVAYQKAFEQARAELLEQALALSPTEKAMDMDALMQRPYRVQAAVQAWHYRELLAKLEFAAVISADHNDPARWARWSDNAAVESHIKRFKKPLSHKDPDKQDPLAFLVVRTMLLTGFDAPIEAVLYLDKPIREAELLQAVARVNRTGFGKRAGFVVDYYGVAHHLQEALAAYSAEDVEGALQSLKDDIPTLRDRHLRTIDVLRAQGVESLDDVEAVIEALGDERVRAEFTVKFKQFTALLDEVLPRPEGLEFTADAKRLAHIYAASRGRYKDMVELGRDVGAKVRRLVEDHVISLGIDPRIPPVQLTDTDFERHINRQVGDRAKASEMEHAIRAHIRKHMDEDPVKYGKLSERLKELLEKLEGQWQEQMDAFGEIKAELHGDARLEGEDLPHMPEHCLPFLRLLTSAKLGDDQPDAQTQAKLMDATAEVVEILTGELRIPDFWKPARVPDQTALRTRLFRELAARKLLPMKNLPATADKLMELARANHEKLTKA
ncbi:type I restriction endonuclease subunit R [Alkalilimnicola sp. S0819]|uniref:type I restriction endonuclease subunit R n=1 Tax=Alkalilimnicola sp. S0819 TaxID=2613922 RepID=UPI0012626719|nr:type I restriction endonuclease subunit R [Alkalilimnicola sp. S0819]KAB7627599.1 type I restriction endonuclease subunit R [Alkalilimnicola sp. S0819]MPQ15761.1 HsdR family type I site-specific deoxyribonuclease [Alkalilimnicola sp. S0819]